MISKSIEDYINNNIGKCDNKLELAYTIYILLGKVLYYSPFYVRYKLDNLLPDVSSISLENPYVNCETWSNLYNNILLEYGIDSKVVGDKHKKVIFLVDDIKVNADATLYLPDDLFDVSSDLTNIKFGLDILYFTLINKQYREEFNKSIDKVNNRLNINKGNDCKVLKCIKSNLEGNKDIFMSGMCFYNEFYKLCDGEVERRQLFERYYPLLFGNNINEVIDFYDNGIISKHLLILGDKYLLETKDGFISLSYVELIKLIESKKIEIRYEKDLNKIHRKIV